MKRPPDMSAALFLIFLGKLSPKLNNSLPNLLVGNIITLASTNHPASLQIGLSVFLRESKVVKTMNAFGVTCTYDELLQFNRSAATAVTTDSDLASASKTTDSLVQCVVDNFDADSISE